MAARSPAAADRRGGGEHGDVRAGLGRDGGGLYRAGQAGHPDLITYDMGGTSSSDVGPDSRTACRSVSGELELEYAMPIHVPMVDVHTIGAGGGSIASVDAMPACCASARRAPGREPGPICYGRGGARADDHRRQSLVLGRLNPDRGFWASIPSRDAADHVRGRR
jgi:N-methylhydantoinase A